MKYAWKHTAVWRRIVPAEVAGKAIQRLIRENDGRLAPALVVEAARARDHPLHAIFDWDDSSAAAAWRIQQAQAIVASIVMVDDGRPEDSEPIRAFVSLYDDDGERGYESTIAVMSDGEKRARLLNQALAELESWERRYNDFVELAGIYHAIEQAKPIRKGKRAAAGMQATA